MIRYVFSADQRVMFSLIRGRLTIWSLIDWWGQVKKDQSVHAAESYVQLIKIHTMCMIEINRVEICNFWSRVSEQSHLLPRRSAIWCDGGMIDAFNDIFKIPSTESSSEIVAFDSLEVACFWLGATNEQMGQAKTLFDSSQSFE